MKQVTKVVMFVYRIHNGQNQFFVLHRKKGDSVILTGHVGDTVPNESLEEAARREVKEELGVEPISITDIGYSASVVLEEHGKASDEHSFLIKIPDQYVYFLEAHEPHGWYGLKELENVLTYDSQRSALPTIKNFVS